MQIKLPERWIRKLLEVPETGMGFQKVLVIRKKGPPVSGIVYNADMLNISDSDDPIKVEDILDIKVNPKKPDR